MPEDDSKEISLTIPALTDMELAVTQPIELLGEALGMSAEKIDDAKLAVVEACINAFHHSCCEDRKVYLKFRVAGSAGVPAGLASADRRERLEITVTDSGRGFDVESCLPESDASPPRGLHKRGYGLRIIRGLMDDVEISSDAGGTTVTMLKYK